MAPLQAGHEFFEKVIDKYTTEFIASIVIIQMVKAFANSKLYVIILYIVQIFRMPIFNYLYGDVINHKVFNTFYQLKLKNYLKYVKNYSIRDQLEICLDATIIKFLTKESFLNNVQIKTMLWSSKKEFLNSLMRELEGSRTEHVSIVRGLVGEKKISNNFAIKYLAWTDLLYQSAIDRVKDLIPNGYNNYKTYVQFLYIVSDMFQIYMDYVAVNVNIFRLSGDEKIVKKKVKQNDGNTRVVGESGSRDLKAGGRNKSTA